MTLWWVRPNGEGTRSRAHSASNIVRSKSPQLAQARFQVTNTAANFDQNTSTYTAAGKQQLQSAADAWDRYVALNPKNPNLDVARIMVQAFAPSALNQPDKAVAAEELVIDNGKPTATDFKQLAALAVCCEASKNSAILDPSLE